MRLILLVLATTLICVDSFGGTPNDRIDEVLAVIMDMNRNVKTLTDKVNGMEETVHTISEMEDATAEHVAKLEDKVDDVTKQVGDVTKQVGDVTKQVGDVTKQVGDVTKQVGEVENQVGEVKTQINVVDEKVEKVDSDVIQYNTWKFVGRGYEGSHDEEVDKDGTTMKECLELCRNKRMSDGGEWDGVVWYVPNGRCWCQKNDRGHREQSNYLHFRAQ